jgi:hypothetical protein
MDEACLPVPSTKKHASRQIFFPSPVGCPKSTGGDGVKMWMHPGLQQLQPLIAINPFSVFNAQQGSRGNARTSSRGLVA